MKKKFGLPFLLVLILGFILIQNNSYSIDDKPKNVKSPLLSKNVLNGIAVAARSQGSYKIKIASTLQKVGKTLYLKILVEQKKSMHTRKWHQLLFLF